MAGGSSSLKCWVRLSLSALGDAVLESNVALSSCANLTVSPESAGEDAKPKLDHLGLPEDSMFAPTLQRRSGQ